MPYLPSSVFRCFKCISVYFGVYTDRFLVSMPGEVKDPTQWVNVSPVVDSTF